MLDKHIGWAAGGALMMYRLTLPDGTPLNAGLSNSMDAAVNLAKSHGWRPSTADVTTQPKPSPTPKKNIPKQSQSQLDLGG